MKTIRVSRILQLTGGTILLMSVGQCVVIGAARGRLEYSFGRASVGCNGVELRCLWTEDGRGRIAWDEVGGLMPTWTSSPLVVQASIPAWIPALFGLVMWNAVRLATRANSRNHAG